MDWTAEVGTFFREEPWSPVVKDVEGLECDNDVITLYFRMLTLWLVENQLQGDKTGSRKAIREKAVTQEGRMWI